MAGHDRSASAADPIDMIPDIAISVGDAIEAAQPTRVVGLTSALHYAELADLLEQLNPDQRARLVEILAPGFAPEILPELDEAVREEVAGHLGAQLLAGAIVRLESDDALVLLSSLKEARQRQVMQAIPMALRDSLEQGLAYPEDSAGRLMQRDLVAVPMFWTVGETIDYLRQADSLPSDFYDIFVVDPGHRPVGAVSLAMCCAPAARRRCRTWRAVRSSRSRSSWTRRRSPSSSPGRIWSRRRSSMTAAG